MERTIVSVDGRLVAGGHAKISIEDWGFRYGWGAFETIRVLDGRPVFLTRHLERFSKTARALLLAGKDESAWWRRAILKALSRAVSEESVLNLYWTRGEAPVFCGRKIICLRPQQHRRRGRGRVWVAPWQIGPGVPGTGAKTLAYLPYTYSSICAQAAGFADAVLANTDGRIADGASASVFLVDKGRLLTPPCEEGALPGITRGIVLELAEKLGIATRVVPIPIGRLRTSEGVFLTSALRGLWRVDWVDDIKIPMSPRARQVFVHLKKAYQRSVADDLSAFEAENVLRTLGPRG